MPVYEYQCSECGKKFEIRQSMGEDGSKLSCPNCSSSNLRRILSSFFSQGSASDISCPTCNSGTCGLPPME